MLTQFVLSDSKPPRQISVHAEHVVVERASPQLRCARSCRRAAAATTARAAAFAVRPRSPTPARTRSCGRRGSVTRRPSRPQGVPLRQALRRSRPRSRQIRRHALEIRRRQRDVVQPLVGVGRQTRLDEDRLPRVHPGRSMRPVAIGRRREPEQVAVEPPGGGRIGRAKRDVIDAGEHRALRLRRCSVAGPNFSSARDRESRREEQDGSSRVSCHRLVT